VAVCKVALPALAPSLSLRVNYVFAYAPCTVKIKNIIPAVYYRVGKLYYALNRSLPKDGNGYGASPLRRFRFSAGILVKKKRAIIGTRFRGSKLGFYAQKFEENLILSEKIGFSTV